MNARERLAQVAAWFVPLDERTEPVHTALDVSRGSTPRFVRELAGLAWYGYGRRAADIAGSPPGRVFADGLAQGAVWVVILELADLLAHIRTVTPHGPLESWTAAALLAAVLALGLIGLDRLAGIAGVGWLAVWIPILAHYRTPAGMMPLLVPLCGFVVLLVAPRRRPMDARRLLWFAVPAAIAITVGPGQSGAVLIWLPVVLVVAGVAVLMLPTDPRPAIAAALPITYVGAQNADRGDLGSIVLTSAVFVVLTLAILVRRLRGTESESPTI